VPRHIGLLRGINVGGKHRVPMAELRTLLEGLGFTGVDTYVQSGNVVFTSVGPVTSAGLEAALAQRFGFDIAVVLRTPAQMRRIVDDDPFPLVESTKLHVVFTDGAIPAKAVAELDVGSFAPEELVVHGREAYLHLPGGMGRARMPAVLLSRLAVRTTVRNWNTVTTLAGLAHR